MSVISLQNVVKTFGTIRALREISLEVNKGELFGVIGPDGAGKTTMFRILTTLIKPDEGECEVLGLDPVTDYYQLRPKLGYMPGKFSLYQDLSVRENMDFFATVFGTTLEENYDLVEPIYSQLEKFESRKAGALSGGMKQKLALSCALIHKPELLVLDEPTTGVDAVSRQEFWDMLHHLKSENLSIIVSTPYMDEAEQCDRIALINEGQILQIDTPKAIVADFDKQLYAVKADNQYQMLLTLRDYEYSDSVQPFGEFGHYIDQREHFEIDEIVTYLEEQGLSNVEMHAIKPVIEDSFIRLMEAEQQKEVS